MRIGRWIALAAPLVGCTPADGEPYWALDPIALYPEDGGIYGIQSWELFSEGWGRNFGKRFYLCAVVVELEGTATTACDDCSEAWSVDPGFVESDCAAEIAADPGFLALRAIGIGDALPEVAGKVPHPDEASGAWGDYGAGWEAYGWAYPEVLDHGGDPASTSWDGTEPFALRPAFAWELP